MLVQQYFKARLGAIFLVAAALCLLSPAAAGTIDHSSAGPDILSGPNAGPCASQASGADYAAGVDATGNPVVPAEGPGANASMGEGRVLVTVPGHHGRDVSVPVDLAKLSPPVCNTAPAHSPR